MADDGDGGETSVSKRGKEDLITQEDVRRIEFYQKKLQLNLEEPFACEPHGSVQRTDKRDFDFYTYVSIIHVDDTDISCEHEVRQMERNRRWQDIQQSEMVMKKAGQEIQLSDIFKDPYGKSKLVKTVMSIGNARIGKTFLVNKFVSDWAKKKHQYPNLVFVFQFRYLNLLRGQSFTLAQLIHECIDAAKCIPEDDLNYFFTKLQKSGNPNYDKSPFKLLFVFDGLDESTLGLHFNLSHHDCSDDFSTPIPLEELLVNLMEGKLLRCAHIWITTRPAAANQIPSVFVDMMMEVKGFTDAKKEEYFRKTFSDDEELANRIISHMKTSNSLHVMCEIPMFCSMAGTVLRDMVRRDETGQLPKNMTEMNCRFLVVLTKRKNEKYDDSHDKDVLLKLGRLAFEHLEKGRIIFYQSDLENCGLDVKDASVYSGVCTEIFKEESLDGQKNVYSFIHLSIQEFLAAVYLFRCFTQKNMEVLETFLGRVPHHISLDDFLQRFMEKALESENGHLDLFVRFLHGLLLESNQSLLGGLLGQTENSPESIQRVINNLKRMTTEDYYSEREEQIMHEMDLNSASCTVPSPDRMLIIFQCLMEMNDHSVFQEIQQYLQSEDRSNTELSESQCSALAFMLQMSEEVVDELYLDTYNTSEEGRQRLIPAVRNSRKARLVDCGMLLEQTDCEVVSSALSSNPSHLTELDLSGNKLDMVLLSAGLKSQHCRLQVLRLTHCWLSERDYEVLASALSSNPSHLRLLDLRFNVLPESALNLLSGLENLSVKHGGEHWTNPQLLTRYFQRLTLDTNTAHSRFLSLSENNREVTLRRDDQYHGGQTGQVLCTEGLTGRHHWKVEWNERVDIGVTYRRIKREGDGLKCLLGYNDQSWSLICDDNGPHGDNYYVNHNGSFTALPVRTPNSNPVAGGHRGQRVYRTAVYVDCPAGTLSFYDVTSDPVTHLYTFHNLTFTEPLYPGFLLFADSSVSLCEDRQV